MGLYMLIPTFTVIIVSILIVRVGAIALRMTGLDERTANFQALSAFTRAGFTTGESETVVSNPQRRRIISWLIILGNAGIAAVIVTATSSLVSSTDYKLAINIVALIVGVYIIYRIASHAKITRRWERVIESKLEKTKFFTAIPIQHLLYFSGGYGVARSLIGAQSPLLGRGLDDELLVAANISVLGVERRGEYLPQMEANGKLEVGDVLLVYGKFDEVDARLGGRGTSL